jgi:hypothetical protein
MTGESVADLGLEPVPFNGRRVEDYTAGVQWFKKTRLRFRSGMERYDLSR